MRSHLSCVWIRGWVGAFLVSCVGPSVVSHVSWITSLLLGAPSPALSQAPEGGTSVTETRMSRSP